LFLPLLARCRPGSKKRPSTNALVRIIANAPSSSPLSLALSLSQHSPMEARIPCRRMWRPERRRAEQQQQQLLQREQQELPSSSKGLPPRSRSRRRSRAPSSWRRRRRRLRPCCWRETRSARDGADDARSRDEREREKRQRKEKSVTIAITLSLSIETNKIERAKKEAKPARERAMAPRLQASKRPRR